MKKLFLVLMSFWVIGAGSLFGSELDYYAQKFFQKVFQKRPFYYYSYDKIEFKIEFLKSILELMPEGSPFDSDLKEKRWKERWSKRAMDLLVRESDHLEEKISDQLVQLEHIMDIWGISFHSALRFLPLEVSAFEFPSYRRLEENVTDDVDKSFQLLIYKRVLLEPLIEECKLQQCLSRFQFFNYYIEEEYRIKVKDASNKLYEKQVNNEISKHLFCYGRMIKGIVLQCIKEDELLSVSSAPEVDNKSHLDSFMEFLADVGGSTPYDANDPSKNDQIKVLLKWMGFAMDNGDRYDKLIKIFFKHFVSLSWSEKRGHYQSILKLAVRKNHVQLVRWIIEAGRLDLSRLNSGDTYNVFSSALRNENLALMKFLQRYGAKANTFDKSLSYDSGYYGKEDIYQAFLKTNPCKLHLRNKLDRAIFTGDLDRVEVLLENPNADFNAEEKTHAMMLAAEGSFWDILATLIVKWEAQAWLRHYIEKDASPSFWSYVSSLAPWEITRKWVEKYSLDPECSIEVIIKELGKDAKEELKKVLERSAKKN